MSDTDRMYRLLCERPGGVHTHDLRKMGYTGNPSQRAADIEAKFGVEIQRERESRNGRPGSRYKLSAGNGADPQREPGVHGLGNPTVGAASGRGSTGGRGQAQNATAEPVDAVPGAPARSVPSFFDYDADWAA